MRFLDAKEASILWTFLQFLNPHATKSKSLFEFEQEDQIRRLLDSEHQVDVQCLNFEPFSVVRGGTT
jgi:hypothetical protein